MAITHPTMKSHSFLAGMYGDDYFPQFLVDKCKRIFIDLCEEIERQNPADTESLFRLTHAAVESINRLESEFRENGSELETSAREGLADDFGTILEAYGFGDVQLEDAIANRDW